jgi:hypothetical protein
MKTLLFVLLSFFFSFNINKKSTIIVIDEKTREELIGVKVMVDTTTYYTDLSGIVVIDQPINDDCNIKLAYPSYNSKELKDVVLESMIITLKQK